MKAFVLFVLALVFGLASVQSAEAVVLFPRLALQRQRVVVQQHAIVAQPFVLRQRAVFVAPFVAPLVVTQPLNYQQQIIVPQYQQFRSFQSFTTPGCGAFLVR